MALDGVTMRGSSQQPPNGNRVEQTVTFVDADNATDDILSKDHTKHTLRVPHIRKVKSKYMTARGNSVFWTNEDEVQHEVKAFVRETSTLQTSQKWEELIQKGVTHLIIEDDDNHLHDIPMDICQLQTLRSLKLMWSRIKAIPEALFHMELKELCLHKCPLKSIENVQCIRGIVSLELVTNGLKKIPKEIGEMTNLCHLDLTGNELKSLPDSLGNLTELRTLKVCGNFISELPSSLVELQKLTTLDCSQNHIKVLPASIGNLRRLVTARLSHNQISELPQSFGNLQLLKHLFLSYNRFKKIPKVLGSLAELQTLNMVSNHISSIPHALPKITTLLLDKNHLSELDDALFLSERLEKLSVQYNKLSSISPRIAHLRNLRALYVAGNNITKLPEEIATLENLRHFVVRENKVQELPTYFDRLKCLSVVDIDDTQLAGIFAHALKNDGIKGLFQEVKARRELNSRSSSPTLSGGSSQLDEEDEDASEDNLDDDDDDFDDDAKRHNKFSLTQSPNHRRDITTMDFEGSGSELFILQHGLPTNEHTVGKRSGQNLVESVTQETSFSEEDTQSVLMRSKSEINSQSVRNTMYPPDNDSVAEKPEESSANRGSRPLSLYPPGLQKNSENVEQEEANTTQTNGHSSKSKPAPKPKPALKLNILKRQ